MNVRIENDWDRLRARADEWNAMLDPGTPESSFLTFEWYDALRTAHTDDQQQWTMVADDGGSLVAVWPLHAWRQRVAAVIPCRMLADGGAWFIPHNGIPSRGEPGAIASTLLESLVRRGGWDVLQLDNVVDGGAWHQAYMAACERLGLRVFTQAGVRSPFLPLKGTWDEYLAACSSKFRSDLRRCEKSMARLGDVSTECITDASELPAAYERVLAIERESWKHKEGTAITSRPWEGRFYETLVESAGRRGWLQIMLASVDGRPVAHDIGLVVGARYTCLKTSFVEDVRGANPGKVVRQRVLAGLHERGCVEHDFIGEAEPWKVQWTEQARTHVRLTICRSRLFGAILGRFGSLRGSTSEQATDTAPDGSITEAR